MSDSGEDGGASTDSSTPADAPRDPRDTARADLPRPVDAQVDIDIQQRDQSIDVDDETPSVDIALDGAACVDDEHSATPCEDAGGDCTDGCTPESCGRCDDDGDCGRAAHCVRFDASDRGVCVAACASGCADGARCLTGLGSSGDPRSGCLVEGCGDCADGDLDGVCAIADSCAGDDADDGDGDGVCDAEDQCDLGDDALDFDADGQPDACDPCPFDPHDDDDADGVCGDVDLCPGFPDSADADGDGMPDTCDMCPFDALDDVDADGVCADADVCPLGDDGQDADEDRTPDACDTCPLSASGDSDGDGVCDDRDACPGATDLEDADGDGIPDACDPCPHDPLDDGDGDGVCGDVDTCPVGDDHVDGDGDGTPDACDACTAADETDSDGDGVCDPLDACPGGRDDADSDSDGVPNACDTETCADGSDNDGNGLVDCSDPACRVHASCWSPTVESCSSAADDDRDGLTNCEDPDCSGIVPCVFVDRQELCANQSDDDLDGMADCADPDCREFSTCSGSPSCDSEWRITTPGRYGVRPGPQANVCSFRGNSVDIPLELPAGSYCVLAVNPDTSRWAELVLGAGTDCALSDAGCATGSNRVGMQFSSGGSLKHLRLLSPLSSTHDIYVWRGTTCSTTPPSETQCGNGRDDDGDDAVDCADADCRSARGCTPEICSNTLDDDVDGLADCADPDCRWSRACRPDCAYPTRDCEFQIRSNTCETNLLTSTMHCGGCGNRCSTFHATPTCDGGACTIAACDPTWSDCDGDPTNGCEVQLGTPDSCVCGEACDDGLVCFGEACVENQVVGIRSGPHSLGRFCARRRDGSVACWTRSSTVSGRILEFGTIPRLRAFSVGSDHVCGLDAEGVVWCAGDNGTGECREGGAASYASFVRAYDGIAVEMAAGENTTCVRVASGEVECWGANGRWRVMLGGVPVRFSRLVSSKCGVQMATDAYMCWNVVGRATAQSPPSGGLDAPETSASSSGTTCELDDEGQVWCRGAALGDGQRGPNWALNRRFRVAGLGPGGAEQGQCNDGVDNDLDGHADGADSDCVTSLSGLGLIAHRFLAETVAFSFEDSHCGGRVAGPGPEERFRWTPPGPGAYGFSIEAESWTALWRLEGESEWRNCDTRSPREFHVQTDGTPVEILVEYGAARTYGLYLHVELHVCSATTRDCDGDSICETAIGVSANCGGCGDSCGMGEVCNEGSCEFGNPYREIVESSVLDDQGNLWKYTPPGYLDRTDGVSVPYVTRTQSRSPRHPWNRVAFATATDVRGIPWSRWTGRPFYHIPDALRELALEMIVSSTGGVYRPSDSSTAPVSVPADLDVIDAALAREQVVPGAGPTVTRICVLTGVGEVWCQAQVASTTQPWLQVGPPGVRFTQIDGTNIYNALSALSESGDLYVIAHDGTATLQASGVSRFSSGEGLCIETHAGDLLCRSHWYGSGTEERTTAFRELVDVDGNPIRSATLFTTYADIASGPWVVLDSGEVLASGAFDRYWIPPQPSMVPVPDFPPHFRELFMCDTYRDEDGDGAADHDDTECTVDIGSGVGPAVYSTRFTRLDRQRSQRCGAIGASSGLFQRMVRWIPPADGIVVLRLTGAAPYSGRSNVATAVRPGDPIGIWRCSDGVGSHSPVTVTAGEPLLMLLSASPGSGTARETIDFTLSIEYEP